MMDEDDKKKIAEWLAKKDDPNLTFTEILTAPDLPENLKREMFSRAAPGAPDGMGELMSMMVAVGLKTIIDIFRTGDYHSEKVSAVIMSFANLLRQSGPTFCRAALFSIASLNGDMVRTYLLLHGKGGQDPEVHFTLDDPNPDRVQLLYARVLAASVANHAQDVFALIHSTDDVDDLVEVFLNLLQNTAEMFRDRKPNAVIAFVNEPVMVEDDASSLLDQDE
jgi:hypothetical protein